MKIKIAFLLVLFALVSHSQEFKIKAVTVEDLKETSYPTDSSAVAAILFKKGKTSFKFTKENYFVAEHKVTVRIKIYKKEGLSWANAEVPYYVGYDNLKDDNVQFSEAGTYNLEDNVVVKTKLKNEGSFVTKVEDDWKKATITLPNVKVGSVLEYTYTIKTENILKFPNFDIQYEIPVKTIAYTTEVPEYYIYKTVYRGYQKIEAKAKLENKASTYESEYNNTVSVSYKQIKTDYTANNLPALHEEEYVDNLRNYKASIINELERVRLPDQPVKDYSITWEGVAKTIFEEKKFGDELKKINYLANEIQIVLANKTSYEEKFNAVFEFVKNRVKWNKEYGYLTDKGVETAFKEGTGNVAEVNMILIAMLRLAGIDTEAVLVSTLSHGKPVFPNRTGFDYVIAAATLNGKEILLDATRKYNAPNIVALEALNWYGRKIKKDGTSSEINLYPKDISGNMFLISAKMDADKTILGQFNGRMNGYNALNFREKYGDVATESYLEKLENTYNAIEISDYKIKNKNTETSKAVEESFSFKDTNNTEIIGDKLYINPLLFFGFQQNPFVQEKREMPIYFGYASQNKYIINLEIPEGYVLESLPKGLLLKTESDDFSFKYILEQKDNKIQIIMQKDITVPVMPQENYAVLKEFYQKMIEKQNEKIVLKRL